MTAAPPPGSLEWQRIVTASKVSAIIGVSPWDSPYSMWRQMRGDLPRDAVETPAMRRGNILEPAVLAWWRQEHPDHGPWGTQVYVPLDGWAGATLDALTTLDGAPVVVEAKTSARADEWGEPGTDVIPVHYLTQVYWQLALTGARVAHVAVLLGPGLEFREYVIREDAAIQADLIARCRAFHASLAGDEPPPLDDHVATIATLRREHPDIDPTAAAIPHDVAREWIAARCALDTATARERQARAHVLNHMGTARLGETAGIRVARRQPARGGTVALIPTLRTPDLIPGDAA